MLPIPLEVRRGPWENQKRRARDLESVRRQVLTPYVRG
jgi:hypothetical protein